jgi:hypothetical protein
MNRLKIALFFIAMLIIVPAAFAQGTGAAAPPVEMAEGMRSNGKIYVVVAVLLTVLIGLLLYVFRLDRKIGQLEKGNTP